MSPFLHDVLANLVSSIALLVPSAVLVAGLLRNRRRRLHRFFGVGKSERLFVYLSALEVPVGGVKDRFGNTRPYTRGLPESEFKLVPLLSSLFSTTMLESLPELLSVSSSWLARPPVLDFRCSPKTENELSSGPTVCIGGPRHNTAAAHYFHTCKPSFLLEVRNERWSVVRNRGQDTGKAVIEPDGWETAILLKVFDKSIDTDSDVPVFVAAGIEGAGTRAAIYYLITHWRQLQNRYRDSEFGLCLKYPSHIESPDGYRRADVLEAWG